jgi:hypothetical protein
VAGPFPVMRIEKFLSSSANLKVEAETLYSLRTVKLTFSMELYTWHSFENLRMLES